ncbi:MAG: hypothetical protein Q9187_005045 [Circinaria calcarea]
MAPPSLSDMPSEIILSIFKVTDDLSTVTSLAGTVRIFYDIWGQNTTAITDSVLQRSFECYDDAQKLIEIQDEVKGVKKSGQDHHVAIERIKRFRSNASTVDAVFDVYNAHVYYLRKQYMSPAEGIRFKQSFYRLWAFTWLFHILYTMEEVFSACAATPLRDLYAIVQTALWQFRSIQALQRSGISRNSEPTTAPDTWMMLSCSLNWRVNGSEYLPVHFPDIYQGEYLVLDECQGFLDEVERQHSSSA